MRYRCIKEMYIQECDGDGFEIPNRYGHVEVGSIWERDDKTDIIGGDVHLDRSDDDPGLGWIEIPFEKLDECFSLMEG